MPSFALLNQNTTYIHIYNIYEWLRFLYDRSGFILDGQPLR